MSTDPRTDRYRPTAPPDVYDAACVAWEAQRAGSSLRLAAAVDAAYAAGVAAGRTAAAADIRAALAEDEADSDVSSGEAIWEQGGYRQGLHTAAEIAEGKTDAH